MTFERQLRMHLISKLYHIVITVLWYLCSKKLKNTSQLCIKRTILFKYVFLP